MIKRYIWSFAEKFGQGLFVSDKGDYVKYEDYAALQQKLYAMAAENAALKESVEHAAGCINAAEFEGLQDALESQDGERISCLVHRRLRHAYLPTETPATDAYLNSVRAEAVVEASAHLADMAEGKSPHTAELIKSCGRAVFAYAAELRSGTHDTADKAG